MTPTLSQIKVPPSFLVGDAPTANIKANRLGLLGGLGEKGIPQTMTPRGLPRSNAAEYVGCSPSKFDQMVEGGDMPKPRLIGTKRVWDRIELDEAFDALPRKGEEEDWDAFIDAA